MHKNGWRPFWAALGAALLVLLPLVGGTVLLTRQMVRTRIQTAQPQSGVPIQLPRAEHRMTLLLCTAGEQPGFLLVYLNAAQNSLNLLAVPGELTVQRRDCQPCPLLRSGGARPVPSGASGSAGPAGGYVLSGAVPRRAGKDCFPLRAGAGGVFGGTDCR